MPRIKWKEGMKKVFLLILSLIISLAVAELCLNLFFPLTGNIFKPYSFQVDEKVGFTMATYLDYNITWYYEPQGIAAQIQTDKYGFRVPDSSLRIPGDCSKSPKEAKQPIPLNWNSTAYPFLVLDEVCQTSDKINGVKSAETVILGIGDSMTFGAGVHEHETFLRLLEQGLKRKNVSVTIINAGVSGYGPTQEILTAEKYLPLFKPDLVILTYYTGNDLRDDYFFKNRKWELFDGYLVIVDPEKSSTEKEMLKYLKTSQLHTLIQRVIRNNKPALQLFRFFVKNTDASNHQYSVEYGSRVTEQWDFTSRNIRDFQKHLQQQGISFIVMVIPEKVQFDAAEQEKTLISNNKVPGEMDFLKVNKLLQKIAAEEGIQLLDLYQPMRKDYAKYYFSLDGHLNRKGHQLASELLLEEVNQMWEGLEEEERGVEIRDNTG